MNRCPTCGGEFEESENICPYCKSLIQDHKIKDLQKVKNNRSQKKRSETLRLSNLNLKDIKKIWNEANKALKHKNLDRFIRKLGAAVEQAVVYKHFKVFGEGPPNIKWGMKNLREKGLINERQSNLNWIWDTRNELTHIAVDIKSKEIQRALMIGESIINGCLN